MTDLLKGTGNIDLTLPDCIQFLAQSTRSGGLAVSPGTGEQAILYFRQGNLIHAQRGSRNGNEVVLEVLRWDNPTFRFLDTLRTSEKSITLRADALLLAAADDLEAEVVEDPSNVGGSLGQTIRRIADFEEVRAWVLTNSFGQVLACDGADNPEKMADAAACLAHCAERSAEPLGFEAALYSVTTLDGFALVVLACEDTYLGLGLISAADPRSVASRAGLLLGTVSEATLAIQRTDALRVGRSDEMSLSAPARGLDGILHPLRRQPGVAGLFVGTRTELIASTLPQAAAQIELCAALGRTFEELGTLWPDINEMAFVYEAGKETLVKYLGDGGVLVVMTLAGINHTLLSMPINIAARTLVSFLRQGGTPPTAGNAPHGAGQSGHQPQPSRPLRATAQ